MSEIKKIKDAMNDDEKSVYEKFKAIVTSIKAKFNNPTPAPTPTPTTAPVALEKVMTSKDGKTFSIAADAPAMGVAIMETTSGTPAPFEGTAEFEDGSKIIAVAGSITEYTPAAPPIDQAAAVQQAQAALKADFAAQKVSLAKEIETKFAATISEQNKTISDLNEIVKFLSDFHIKQMETPVNTPVKKAEFKELTKDEVSKLSTADQVKYHRGKL